MIKVRLSRTGTKKTPLYRIVVTNSRSPRDGRHLENIGTYDPRAVDASKGFLVDRGRLAFWQGFGAQVSEEVGLLLKRHPTAAAPGPAPRPARIAVAPSIAKAPAAAPEVTKAPEVTRVAEAPKASETPGA